MNLPSPQAGKPRRGTGVFELCLMAVLGVLLYVLQVALGFLPNIELVSLCVILFTLVFKKRVAGILAVFLLLEFVTYGFNTWVIMYLYVWPLLALLTHLFRRMDSALGWALLSGAFGLSFGLLCSLTYLFIGGISAATAYFLGGILYDIPHCIGNFVLMLLLYRRLRSLLERLDGKLHR